MKYIIYILFFVCFGLSVKAQVPTGFPSQRWAGWIEPTYVVPDSGTIITKRDTSFIPRFVGTTVTWQRPGIDTTFWFWNGAHWGRVTLAQLDTTSLSNRINLKLNISDTASMLSPYLRKVDTLNKWVQNVYARNDSLFKVKNGTETFVHIFPTSGAGTVTSVALSMPAAFTVSGSPITTSGTFNVSGAGTSAQYIKGNGTLGTFDTSAIPNFYLKVRGLLSGASPITYNSTIGAIGINNANTTGTKGAASFTSSFSDNGAGQIDLATLVSAGSCTGCTLNVDAKGRITSYADGPAGATNNTNIGSGFRPVNELTQQMRTYFGGFGIKLDTVANVNGMTWRADTTRVTGLPTYFYVDSSVNANIITANNGLTKTGNNIQLGGPLVQTTNIAVGNNELDIIATNSTTSTTRFTIDNTNAVMSGRYEDFSSINTIYANQDNIQIVSNQPTKSRRILIDSTTGIQIGENIGGIYKGLYINKNTSQLQFNGYTSSNFQTIDTSFNSLVVDASGNIFKRAGDGGGGGGGAPALTYKNVGYGGVGNTLSPGESAFQYDSVINRLTVDTILLKKLRGDTLYLKINTNIASKRAIFFGTSITHGAETRDASGALDTTRRWSTYVCRSLGWLENNYGIPGEVLQNRSPVTTNMITNGLPIVPIFNSTTDTAIFLEFSINDCTKTGQGLTNYNTTNFITDYTTVIDTIKARGWPVSSIYLIGSNYVDTIINSNNTYTNQIAYWNATKTVATNEGVNFIDVFTNSFINRNSFFYSDMLHPSNTGHSIYGIKVLQAIGASVVHTSQTLATNGQTEIQKISIKETDTSNVNYQVVGIDQYNNAVKLPNGAFIENNPLVTQFGGINLNGYQKLYTNSLGVAQRVNSGITLQNQTAATLSGQQMSPKVSLIGNYWNTDSSSSQPIEFKWEVLPSAGTGGSNQFFLRTAKNTSGAYTIVENISADGSALKFSENNANLTTFTLGGSDVRMNINGVYDVYGQNVMNFHYGGGSIYKYTLTAANIYGTQDAIIQGVPAASTGFDVWESVGAAGIALSTQGGSFPILFATNRVEKARVSGAGALLINRTSPIASELLSVNGKINANADSVSSATGGFLFRDPSGEFKITGAPNTTTIYTGDGTLAGNRALSGATNTLQLGTSGSKISTLTSNVSTAFTVNSDSKINLFGAIVFNEKRASDADYTVTATDEAIRLPSITANRNLVINFNIADTGKVLTIFNENNSANTWSFNTNPVINSQGGPVTTIENNTNYVLQYVGVDGGTAEWRILSVNGYNPVKVSSSGTVTMAYSIYPREEYVATGTTATYTLPTVSSTKVGFTFSIKNRGSGNVTINTNGGGNDIYDTSATNTLTVAAGGSIDLMFDGTYFVTKAKQ